MALPKIEIRGKPGGVDVSSEHKRIREVFFMVTPDPTQMAYVSRSAEWGKDCRSYAQAGRRLG
jgi:hypothetical protein